MAQQIPAGQGPLIIEDS